MQAILTLARKDLQLLFRDRFALFWVFAFPLMFCLFMGSLFGDSGGGSRSGISLAIVDDAKNEYSARLIERLGEHDSLRPTRGSSEVEGERGAVVLHELADAEDLVRRGRRVAFLRIPAGYEESPFQMFGGGRAAGDAERIEVGIDPSRSAEAGFLQGILMETLFGGLAEQFTDKDTMRREISRFQGEIKDATELSALQRGVLSTLMGALDTFFDKADFGDGDGSGGGGGMSVGDQVVMRKVARQRGAQPASSFEITFPSAMIWGLMSVAMGFAVTLVRERTQGTMLRLRLAPIGIAQMLAGKALGCMITCLIVLVFLLLFGHLAMGVRIQSWPMAIVAMLCTSVCFTGLMMVASVLGKTEQAVAGSSWGVMMPFAMIGGGMVPLIAMPPWLVSLSDFSPFKWGIVAMEGAIWRGFSIQEMLVPCGILVGVGAVLFGVGVTIFRRYET